MEIKRKEKEFKALSKVVSKAEIENIYLCSSNVWRSPDALEFENMGAKLSFEGTLIEEHDDHFIAEVNFILKGIPENAEEDDEVISLESEYILTYSIKNKRNITTEDIQIFCEMNSLYNAWPYWREFVQNMLNRMEIPPFVIPLLKFKPRKIKKRVVKKKK